MSDGAFKRSCILGGINENAPVKGRSRPVGRRSGNRSSFGGSIPLDRLRLLVFISRVNHNENVLIYGGSTWNALAVTKPHRSL